MKYWLALKIRPNPSVHPLTKIMPAEPGCKAGSMWQFGGEKESFAATRRVPCPQA
jgi:hypothetical protein